MNTKFKMSFILLLALVGVVNVNAQEKNEIRVSLSDAIPLELSYGLAKSFESILDGEGSDFEIATFGMLNLNYQRSITDRIKVGAGVSYLKFQDKKGNSKDNDLNYLAFMPQFEYTYLKSGILELYGNTSAGVVGLFYKIENKNETDFGFAYQVNPIGIRVGKKIGGFAEVGCGFKGFVNVGIDFKF
ncbi:hypothetical protein OOZ15_18720 [Galbibacter sp. EGI 63066]|uniref:outer membrane beta-barrel protein n=1 Tax=Galbibacter sp. EGI 63066 TaxID=2993559 RepID=UPI0022494CC2|nr:outer membrane beta-barrel protein [Galbibacter sp. EGI 63066]MCX2681992.1 hypothetical protein [Galbibacter sp. EGI 63066]